MPSGSFVSVYFIGCLGYSDQTLTVHGTSFVYQFLPDDGPGEFPPEGIIAGHLENFGLSKAY
jgi:hypothetical protein